MLVSGALHASRGALFPALKSVGLRDEEVRRAWAAMRYGAWQTETLFETWQAHVTSQGEWCTAQYAGYYPKAVDITAYWRPTLKGLQSKHYDAEADRALPAVVFGMVGRVGRVGQQRMALLTDLIRADLTDPSKTSLENKLLQRVALKLGEDEMPVLDAGFKLSALYEAGLPRFVLRLAHYLQVKGSIGLSRAFFSLFRVIFDPSANETGHKTMYLLQELVCFIFKAGRRASMIAKINGFEQKKLVIDRISVRLTCDQCA